MNVTRRSYLALLAGTMLTLLPASCVLAAGESAEQPPASPPAHRVYRTTDAEGNVVFTDVVSDDAEEVELGKTIIFSPDQIRQPDQPIDPRAVATEGAPAFTYRTLAIVEPEQDAVIRDNPGNFTVRGVFEPALRPDHRVQLLMDGEVYASGQAALFALENVDRGVHELQLQIIDNLSGEVIGLSAPVTMTLLRFSRLHPGARTAKPPPKPRPTN